MQKSKEINLILTEDGDLEPNAELKRVIIEAQLDTALKGNSEMLKWLGKQYLNQTDKGDTNEYENKPLPFID
jgi:hypothetical protein|tara:strand:+ start:3435 stop:3650 length:216 start_codon:yes stop_codon:yes gene_type:complete